MNLQSYIVLGIVVLLVILAILQIRRQGGPCSCGSGKGSCASCEGCEACGKNAKNCSNCSRKDKIEQI